MPHILAAVSGESIRRNTAFALLAEALRALFTAGLTLYLVRALGPDDFGIYALAIGIAAFVRLVADWGISTSASRFLAESRDDRAAMASIMSDALRLKLVLGVVFAGLLVALAGPVADAYELPELETPVRLVGAVVLFQSLFQLCIALFVGMSRNDLQARLYLTEGFVETLTSVMAVVLGGGAAGAVGGRAAGFAVAAVIGLVILVRLLGRRAGPRLRAGTDSGRIARYGGIVFVVEGAYTVFEQIDVLLLGALKGSVAAGLFLAPLRIVTAAELPGRAVANAVAPRLASRGASDPAAVASLHRSLRLLILLGALLAAGAVAWADPVVRLMLGREYSESADVLRVLAPFVLLVIPGPLVTVAASYLGLAGRRVPIVISMVVLQIVLDLALIPPLGITGPALATDIVFLLYIGFHVRLLRQAIGLDVRSILRTLTRALLAAAAAAGAMAAFGTEAGLSAGAWAGGLTAAFAAYVAVLLLTREVRPGELAALVRRRAA